MFIKKQTWDRLIESHEAERNALLAANKAHLETIETQKLTIRDLQGRIAYMQQAAKRREDQTEKQREQRKPNRRNDNRNGKFPKPVQTSTPLDTAIEPSKDCIEPSKDCCSRDTTRDEDNYGHKMPEE